MQRPGPNQRLTPAMELSIKQYITRCDRLRVPALLPQLTAAFQTVLDLNDPSGRAEPVGRNLIARWLERNPDCKRVRQKPQEINRVAANTDDVYWQHFHDLSHTLAEYGITKDDCWNMDETGFRIGVGGSQWIVTMDFGRTVQSPNATCRDYSTAIEAVNDAGIAIPPFLILTSAVHLEKWYKNTDLPDDYTVGLSETGYSNDTLSIDWLKHFNKW